MLKTLALLHPRVRRYVAHADLLAEEVARLQKENDALRGKHPAPAAASAAPPAPARLAENALPGAGRVVHGRDVGAGYARGWGLEYGPLAPQVQADPIYAACVAAVRARSLLLDAKLQNLFLILRYELPRFGHCRIAEFGSYRGGSAMFLALACKKLGLPVEVLAFDTFAGMPDTSESLDFHHAGDFADVDIGEIRAAAAALRLDNLVFVQGRFEDTCAAALSGGPPIGLAHIDCDIYDGVRYAVDITMAHAHPLGAYLVFDDPLHGSCLGAFQAIEETLISRDALFAEQAYPHLVYRYPRLPDATTEAAA
jgi:hypothetical protein